MSTRIEILGVPVDCIDMHGALVAIRQMLDEPRPHRIIAVNPEKVVKAQADPELKSFLARSDLLIPDGIGLVLAARLLGLGRMGRVPGADLMPRICELAARTGHKVFLFGAAEEVNAEACRVLKDRYPALVIAGRHNGYVDDAALPELIERINASGAHILFVALGSPRQELWMDAHLHRLDVRVCQGVGGTFDVLAGKVRRAPPSWRNLYMEWLYRLLSEPGRIRRQTALPKFVYRVLRAWLRGPRPGVDRGGL